ncbi:AzlD domain-containing protein [Xanthobacter sp. DSM 24535]|uniref:AzlD family protein n=1 Tax=Roseixanthobacter psychrophilus TaxID=3119917 RepID=UPI0037295FE3
MNSALDPGTVLAICVMAGATIFNRTAGFFLMRLVPVTPRVRRILDSLPGAVLVAIVAPAAVHGDKAMAAGLAVAFLVTWRTKNDFYAVLAAVLVGAAIRALGF